MNIIKERYKEMIEFTSWFTGYSEDEIQDLFEQWLYKGRKTKREDTDELSTLKNIIQNQKEVFEKVLKEHVVLSELRDLYRQSFNKGED